MSTFFDSLIGDEDFDSVLEAALRQIDLREKTFVIRDKYYPLVAEFLPKTERILMRHISQYRDKNINILASPYPTNYPLFAPDDFQIIYKCTRIDELELKDDIANVKLPDGVEKKENFIPFNVAMLLCIRYATINKKKDLLEFLYRYFAYSMWWSVYTKRFKFYLPNEEKMIYTINNFNKKFRLKQLGSVDALLYEKIEGVLQNQNSLLIRCDDYELSYITDNIKSSLNNMMGKLYDEYKKNLGNPNIIMTSSTFVDNEGTERQTSTLTSNVEELANKYTNIFFSSTPNKARVALAAKLEKVSKDEVYVSINILKQECKIEEVKEFYACLFYSYLASGEQGATLDNIKSNKFNAVMSNIFKKGNSADKNIIRAKELMDKWLEIGSKTYRASNRQATLTGLKKAIYNYFIFSVSSNA